MTTTTHTIQVNQITIERFVRRWALTFISLGLFIISLLIVANVNLQASTVETKSHSILIDLANKERSKAGLNSLKPSSVLEQAANTKAKEMFAEGYFEHISPKGRTPWNFINEAGYDYTYAGENLAMDFDKIEDTHTAWMKSPTHKANIVDSHFTQIGIATVEGRFQGRTTTITVEMFGAPQKTMPKIFGR